MVLLLDGLDIDQHHPLAVELSSLRKAASRFQEEAYTSSVKLQRQYLELDDARERAVRIEKEIASLTREVTALRQNPHPDSSPRAHPAVAQVQQLTLALRRLSDKFSLTENALLERTTQVVNATNDVISAKFTAESAYDLAARIRGREEEGRSRELALEMKLKAAEETAKMSDLVVQEYAALVRSLEAKDPSRINKMFLNHSDSSSHVLSEGTANKAAALNEGLAEGKLGLQRLLAEFSETTDRLQRELLQTQEELAVSGANCDAEKKNLDHHQAELARARHELERLKIDDNSAARMVSRYMTFSQQSTDTLQEALEALRLRHKATTDTMYDQIAIISSRARFYETRIEDLSDLVDDLSVEIMKEGHGRRREIALRLRMVSREEKTREVLERWLLRAEEGLARDPDGSQALLDKMIVDARSILAEIFGGVSSDSPGTIARSMVVQDVINTLATELELERTKRLEVEKAYMMRLGHIGPPHERDVNERSAQTTPSMTISQDSSTSPTPDLVPQLPLVHMERLLPPGATPLLDGHVPSQAQRPELPSHDTGLPVHPGSNISSLNSLTVSKSPRQIIWSVHEEQAASDVDDGPPVELELSQQNRYPDNCLAGEDMRSSSEIRAASLFLPEQSSAEVQPHYPGDSLSADAIVDEIQVDEEAEDVKVGSAHLDTPPGPINDINTSLSSDIMLPAPELRILPDSPASKPKHLHPLLADLHNAKRRYNVLQRAFHNCFLALDQLKNDLTSFSNAAPPDQHPAPNVLRTAVQRLTDYTEDARVELEIRVADEELMIRGFETLLSIPGALSSSRLPLLSNEVDTELSRQDVEAQITAFVSGADPSVDKAHRSFTRKLEDIQHDIAALKRALHDDVDPEAATAVDGINQHVDSGLLSWIRSPSTPSLNSPAETPTFGNVMTSPRLRHSPLGIPPARRVFSEGSSTSNASRNPFSGLGLKVPMPSYVDQTPSIPQPQIPQRPRMVSAMYMLGLGAQGPRSGSPSPLQNMQKKTCPPPRLNLVNNMAADGASGITINEEDVE